MFGVILSSLPAALLAFRTGGVVLVFWLMVMILIVHAIEAYGLNPLIFGHHLRMHPVAVLLILLIAEHLFGIWGAGAGGADRGIHLAIRDSGRRGCRPGGDGPAAGPGSSKRTLETKN